MKKTGRNDPCPCGSGKKYKQCCVRHEGDRGATTAPSQPSSAMAMQEAFEHHNAGRLHQAELMYRQVLQVKPNHPDALHNMGLVAHQLGQNEDAVEWIGKAIRAKASGRMYFNQGIVLQALGRLDSAIQSYQKALALQPNYAEAHNNLGAVLQVQGKYQDAVMSFRRAIRMKPDCAEAYASLGNTLMLLGKLDAAVENCRRALSLNPSLTEAHNNLGSALQKQGKLNEAFQSFQHAVAINPIFALAHSNLGSMLLREGKLDEAIERCRIALSLEPNFTKALNHLGGALAAQGKLDEAIAYYQKSVALQPSNETRIKLDLMLPPIMGTKEQVLETRTQFERNLNRLIEEGVTLSDPYEDYGMSPFYLAFQGWNDRNIQQTIARFYERACPDLLYVAPHCAQPPSPHRKMRIGFLSKYIYSHSVSRCYSRVVEAIAQEAEFDVMLISHHDPQDEAIGKAYPNFSGTHVHLPNSLIGAREMVAALELDILVYLDIGMEPLSYLLACSRLARTQCVTGGHPVTTGIRNVDYFLSSDLAEPADADQHYSEKLVRLPLGLFYFERPVLPPVFKTRQELGLPLDGRIYLCPMLLQKLHPDFDDAIARILQLDATGYVVLFQDAFRSTWHELLASRFAQTIPDSVRNRIVFLPWVKDYADFIGMNVAADVVLDPFHFGIGSTAIATCSVGTPFVTRPGEFLRGRVGFFYCKLLDMMECVATGTEDYAQKAVAIAKDHALREKIKSKMLANSHVLFENQQPIKDVTDFFLGLRGEASSI
ncbi:MAG TPA: tetratricopeptide repeat protein [Burkholderiaceae bacterium]|nr:tetratricopeptide repeat protein [Burkholderiaceae bacterium]